MQRRSKGEGSITQLPNGKFRVRLEVNPVGDKRKWVTATATTKKEAVKKLQELQRQKEDKKTLQVLQDDLSTLIEPYLSAKESEGLKVTTLQHLYYELHELASYLEDIPVHKVTKEHIQSYLSFQKSKGLVDRTIKESLNDLRGFFKWLHEDKKALEENPAATVKFKMTQAPRKKQEVLSKDEHKRLKDIMEEMFFTFLTKPNKWCLKYRMYPLYLLTYESGFREGEVAGLKWECVNFEEDTISVLTKVSYVPTKGIFETTPKTISGFRTIKLSHKTMRVLKELQEAYEEKHFHSEYVFANYNKHGAVFTPNNILKTFKKMLECAGIQRNFTFHGIRHTNASLMFASKVEHTVIAERLGHASVATTYKVYTHALQDDEDRRKALVIA